MGAFDGMQFYQIKQCAQTKETQGPAVYPGDWVAENSNTPFIYPWGKKVRNPNFIGPYAPEVQEQNK